MLQESVAQRKMPTNKQLVIPGVTEASGLDLIFQDLLIYVADTKQGVNLLKLGSSRSRQGLTPAGQILKLMVGINNVPGSGCVCFFVNGFASSSSTSASDFWIGPAKTVNCTLNSARVTQSRLWPWTG